MNKKTLYLIHHSHTDIGYTDRQEKISRYHVDFIRRAIAFLDKIEAGEAPEWVGYNYVCENFWQVEQFLAHATGAEKASFEQYVEKGLIDISLTYLNLTELIDSEMLHKKFADAKQYVDQFDRSFDSAMTADINGFSWGYADAMFKNGIRNFYSCLHTHHGMFPYLKNKYHFGGKPNRVINYSFGTATITKLGMIFSLRQIPTKVNITVQKASQKRNGMHNLKSRKKKYWGSLNC